MAYVPKSKYQLLQASGHEFINPLTKSPYIGPYILTGEGAFIGNDIKQKNKIRLITQSGKAKKQDNIFFTEKTNAYFRLKPRVVRFIEKTLPIVATKTKPTEKDNKRGYYTRYFCKRNNMENMYLEIDKSTFKNLKAKNDKHDFHLYTADSLIWSIDGDIIKANSTTLKILSKKYLNISSLFVKLDEFQNVKIAKKGELTYEDGTEYMGPYHIHPTKGPMEGAYHKSEPHKKLLFIDKNTLYKKDLNTEQVYHIHGDHKGSDSAFFSRDVGYVPPSQVEKQITQVVPQPSSTTPVSPTPNTPPPSTPSTGGGGY